MNLKHEAYIINNSAYLYIIDFDDKYDYTFYTDNYLVMDTGFINKEELDFNGAMTEILKKHYLNPENVIHLSDSDRAILLDNVDDYNQVNIL